MEAKNFENPHNLARHGFPGLLFLVFFEKMRHFPVFLAFLI